MMTIQMRFIGADLHISTNAPHLFPQAEVSAKVIEIIVIPEKSQILSGISYLFHRDPRHFLRKFGDDTVRYSFSRVTLLLKNHIRSGACIPSRSKAISSCFKVALASAKREARTAPLLAAKIGQLA